MGRHMASNTMQDPAQTPWLVVTDLDGTLLDHNNYSFEAALPSLKALDQHQVPVIINSSKTAAEIREIQTSLGNSHPFIIENGSAIIYPDNKSTDTQTSTVILGHPRQHILEKLQQLKQSFPSHFRCYSESSAEDIVDMTGLSLEEAKLSLQREYTEPLLWQGDNNSKQAFITLAMELELQCLQGGRFLHLMGNTDKGKATKILAQQYQEHPQSKVKTIALGDSHNDIAMLQAADIAVVIRSPHFSPPEFEHPHKLVSHLYGPAGWDECITQLLPHILQNPEDN